MFKIGDMVRYIGDYYESISHEPGPITATVKDLFLVDFTHKESGRHYHGDLAGREGLWCQARELELVQ